MVVLDGGGMLTSSGNQYLQPDYLSPLPTTLDAKKSPLALLAQTCSQIGADTPSSRALISPLEKTKKAQETATIRSPPSATVKDGKNGQRTTPGESKLGFKPYENDVVSKKSDDNSRPSSKCESVQNNFSNNNNNNTIRHDDSKKCDNNLSPETKSLSPATSSPLTSSGEAEKSSPTDHNKTSSSSSNGASPVIRSGLEIFHAHSKESPLGAYKSPHSSLTSSLSGSLASPLSGLCCPPGLEHTNPAFRPPFPSAVFPHQQASLLSAGYPSAAPNPYFSYARVKTPSGGESLIPVCKDPYCSGCQFSLHNQNLLMSGTTGTCPSGCTQCDHQKYNLAMTMPFLPPNPLPPSSLTYPHLGRPYICNWIVGDNYCGKRFVTSEELLQHLRTHTNSTETTTSGATATTSPSTLLNSHSFFSTPALHRPTYPNPPLSPLSLARYHPYGKPTLGASPYSAFNPTSLGHYYSPYSIYGHRIGAAAVHP